MPLKRLVAKDLALGVMTSAPGQENSRGSTADLEDENSNILEQFPFLATER